MKKEPASPTIMSRFEQKLVVPMQSVGFVISLLQHTCIADPVYPLNTINSLYLDTPELDSYYECLNGDTYKKKVRIRWYDQPDPNQDIPAYIELKSKRGAITEKHRKQLTTCWHFILTTQRRHSQKPGKLSGDQDNGCLVNCQIWKHKVSSSEMAKA